ncbi:MAG: hypothetical protein SXV54_21590 [Chloroflexota bacterium]|nr:hypothetical protein [Chloroflexota bacterium]
MTNEQRGMSSKFREESGRTLVIALLLVALGVLLVTGLLYYVSTSQLATRAARKQTTNHYSMDAGVEHAIWRLTNETGFTQTVTTSSPFTYTITINGQTVVITVTRVLTP